MSVSSDTGAGKRFGSAARTDVQDKTRWQGPPTPEAAYEKQLIDLNRKLNEIDKTLDRESLSTVSGILSRTGAQYGPTRAILQKGREEMRQQAARNDALRNRNLDRQNMPNYNTRAFRQEVSRTTPNVALPSRAGLLDKAKATYLQGRKAFGDALYGPVNREENIGFGYRKGGLVKKKKARKKNG